MAVTSIDICGHSPEDLYLGIEEFHGNRSPGMLVGAVMIDAALDELGSTPFLNVVTETVVCLPDAVQLLTPCTIGNQFLQVLDWGKFALTAYDRETLSGVRVWLEADAVEAHPVVSRWFVRSRGGAEKPTFEELAPYILADGKSLIGTRRVRLHRALKESERVLTGRCPKCGESYALRLGPACPSCHGQGYYDQLPL